MDWITNMDWKSIGILGTVLILLILIITLLAKTGLIKFKGKGLTIGYDDKVRAIVRQQTEYCKAMVDTFITTVVDKEYEKTDKWKKRYIAELCNDVFVDAITFNHITRDTFYIENKTDKIFAIICKYSNLDCFKTKDFRLKIYEEVSKVINKMVDIKEYYEKGSA